MTPASNPRRVPMGWFCLVLAACGVCLAVANADAAPAASTPAAIVRG